jgi:chemotaxis protein histidine kinase CheA
MYKWRVAINDESGMGIFAEAVPVCEMKVIDIKVKPYRYSSDFNIDFYKNEFNEAFSSTELVEFINKYEKEDPDKLIPNAYTLLDKAYKRQRTKDPKAIARQLYIDFFTNIKTDIDRSNFIKLYKNNDPDGLVAKAELGLSESQKREAAEARTRELQQYRDSFKNAHSSSDFSTFISTYYSDDPDKLVPMAKKKLASAQKREATEARQRELREAAEAKARELQQYRDAFKNARSSSDFDTFIQTYQGKDPDRLIAKAKKMKANAERREAAERAEAERREQYRREHQCDHLYQGKKVTVYVKGAYTTCWGSDYEAIVLGFGNGKATVKFNRSNICTGETGEFSCNELR